MDGNQKPFTSACLTLFADSAPPVSPSLFFSCTQSNLHSPRTLKIISLLNLAKIQRNVHPIINHCNCQPPGDLEDLDLQAYRQTNKHMICSRCSWSPINSMNTKEFSKLSTTQNAVTVWLFEYLDGIWKYLGFYLTTLTGFETLTCSSSRSTRPTITMLMFPPIVPSLKRLET